MQNIPIDVCKIYGPDAVFLQQACHLTSGSYFRIQRRAGLLQYLIVRVAFLSLVRVSFADSVLRWADGISSWSDCTKTFDATDAGGGGSTSGLLLSSQDCRYWLRVFGLLVE